MGLLGQEAQVELDQLAEAQQTLALEAEEEAGYAASTDTDVDGLNGEVLSGSEETAESGAVQTAEESAPTAEEPPQTDEQRAARESKDEKEKNRRLREYFRTILDQLVADYTNGDRGLEIREVAGGYRLATKPEYHDAVRGFVKSLKPPLKLSLQALETLAVVAYKQPITAPEVSEIRGVDSGGVLGSLMARKLITTAGRKQVIGRPILYKSTKDFLLRFGLKDINELPSIEEFEKMASELHEQEEIPMEATDRATPQSEGDEELPKHHAPETIDELESQRHTHLPQADGSPDPVDDPLDDELPEDNSPAEQELKSDAEPVEEPS
jgi:segregation and condensation protein B